MTDPTPSKVLESLTTSKQRLVEFSNRLTVASKWDEAQSAIEWARQIDGMVAALSRGNGAVLPSPVRTMEISAGSPTSCREPLPHFYVEHDKLVKVGRSSGSGTYKHRMTHKNFDLVLDQLRDMATASIDFKTPRLVKRCGIPAHEPRIVVVVLERYGLLKGLRKGRWQFHDAASFGDRARGVWQRLPRR